jgi:hypothetical protein
MQLWLLVLREQLDFFRQTSLAKHARRGFQKEEGETSRANAVLASSLKTVA